MTSHSERRVLIAGFDGSARTALGSTWAESWSGLIAGCRRFDYLRPIVADWPDDAPVACLKDWPLGFELRDRARALARALGYDVRPVWLDFSRDNRNLRTTVIVATSHGESYAISEFSERMADRSKPLDPGTGEAIVCDRLLKAFLDGAGAAWPGQTIAAACASASVAVGLAAARIAHGVCDACFVVSLDVLSRVAHAGFRQIGAMSPKGCRPFDCRRDGTTIGEAGTVMLLAAEGAVFPRSARWVVRVQGFGQSCDARHPVEPSADGLYEAIERALAEAGCVASNLAAIYWHGTGTIQNDRTEATVARKLFGVATPPGTTTKGAFGHTMGASAALSILAAGETIQSRDFPPVAGLHEPEFPNLNLAMDRAVRVDQGPVGVVALGFGGINAALVLNSL